MAAWRHGGLALLGVAALLAGCELVQIPVSLVPFAPSDRSWYEKKDDPRTPDNEAARDLARAIARGGLASETDAYARLTGGGSFAIFVGGAGRERRGSKSEWIDSLAPDVVQAKGFLSLQVDYANWAAGNEALNFLTYPFSFDEGVARTYLLFTKAVSAGAKKIRIYGHSKGGDVVQESARRLLASPEFEPALEAAFVFGIPVWSGAIPHADPATGRRGGFFRVGELNERDFRGKLVVFNRDSDRVCLGEFLPIDTFPGDGHDYKDVLAEPRFRSLLEETRFHRPVGYEDRAAGSTWDWSNP